jgi:hypothetical protein
MPRFSGPSEYAVYRDGKAVGIVRRMNLHPVRFEAIPVDSNKPVRQFVSSRDAEHYLKEETRWKGRLEK